MNDVTTSAPPAAAAPAAPPAASPAAPAPSWRDGLSEGLRGDASLANFQNLDQLAQGYIETKRTATSRVPAPGDTPESIKAFTDAIRPADAAVYEIAVPEGMPREFADGFRAKAHELGLQPWQVKGIVEWNNGYLAKDAETRAASEKEKYDAGMAAIEAFKRGYQGDFGQKLQAVAEWLPKLGLDLPEEDQTAMEQRFGSDKVLKFLFAMHDRVGDLKLPSDGGGGGDGGIGGTSPAQAEARQKELYKDAAWRAKAMVEGSAEHAEDQRLTRLVVQGRMQRQRQQQGG